MATVYLETTIPSYLTGRPSRDLVIAANQQTTHEWWADARDRFEIVVSEVVLAEISLGAPEFVARRLSIVKDLRVLPVNETIRSLAEEYVRELPLPPQADVDALHLACAVHHGTDYLVTWNCAHIANGQIMRRLAKSNAASGRFTPIILTPAELL